MLDLAERAPKAFADMAFECRDTSRIQSCDLMLVYFVNRRPPRILGMPRNTVVTVTSQLIQWSNKFGGSFLSGYIDLKSNRWERRVNGEPLNTGICKRLR
jgi:hypothetical protein